MGCGESKHVATGNTISRKSSRAGSRRGKASETIEETRKVDGQTSSLVQDAGKNVNQDSDAGHSGAVMVDGKDIAERPELKNKTMAEETNEESVEEMKLVEDSKDETKEAAMEDKKLDEDAMEETVKKYQKPAEEKKEETANGEPETVKNESLVKESETAESTEAEAEVSTPVEKQEEKLVVSPAVQDLKTE